MRQRLLAGIVLNLMAVLAPASAADIRVEVSGELHSWDCANCYGTPVEALFGALISASFQFPATGNDVLPADPTRGLYRFAPGEAFFTIDTGNPIFDRSTNHGVEVFVARCTTFCYWGEEFVHISAIFGDYRFDLSLTGHNDPNYDPVMLLNDDSLPSVDILQALIIRPPNFAISTPDFHASLSNDRIDRPENPLLMNVSYVPIPTAAWLLGSALAAMGYVRRRAIKCA